MLIYLFLPHLFLISLLLFLLISNSLVIRGSQTYARLICDEISGQTVITLFFVFCLIINSKIEGFSTDYNFKVDFGKNLIQLISVAFMLFSFPSIYLSFRSQNLNFFEFFVLLLLVFLSLLFIINANSLLAIFVAVEIFALCSIILSSFNKVSAFSTEAGLKYFISSAIFSGIFLLGTGLLYFCYGTVCFDTFIFLNKSHEIDFNTNIRLCMEIGMSLVICWLFFKITSAPFHFWVPDVYDGAPLSTTIFFSTVPKLSLIIFLLKFTKIYASLNNVSKGYTVFLLCGILSCIFGFLSALKQKKLKKLFIFSSIGQVGFIVATSFLTTVDGYISVIIFSCIYFITSIIVWNYISIFYSLNKKALIFKKSKDYPLNLTHISNLYRRNRSLAISFVLAVFSLSAIPPMLGFYSKFEIFSALVNADVYFSLILLILLGSLSAFYYMETVRSAFIEGDAASIKNNDYFKITSTSDITFYAAHYISCFLIIILSFGFFSPEIITSFATIVALCNDLY